MKAEINDSHALALLAIQIWHSNTIDELDIEFKEIINSNDKCFFVKKVNNEVIAFAQCSIRNDYVEGTNSSPVGYLEGIIVKEEYRHMGIAKELLKECENWAKEKKCNQFASDCEINNEESLKFHLAMGFNVANKIICFTKNIDSNK